MFTISMKIIKKNRTVNHFKVKRIPVSLFYPILFRYINRFEATVPSGSLVSAKKPIKQVKKLKEKLSNLDFAPKSS